MGLVDQALTWWLVPIVSTVIVSVYLYSYFVTLGHLKDIPAPFPAQFTNLWLLSVCRRGARYLIVDEVHQRLGPIVRIQPNHISIADDEAIPEIYGHGNGFLKA